jgi:hypothetical protein
MPVPIDGVTYQPSALVQWIQWTKDMILIPPMMRDPNPKAATGRRGTTSDGVNEAQCQQEKAQ